MELVSTLSLRSHETSRLQNIDVLRDRLASRTHAVLGSEPSAELEQRLPISFGELIEDRPACGIGDRFEHVPHESMLGKY
jgi:hypothetical protein